jgi:photosystem II stability/assembly factor-like uncharacterized protein
MASPTRTPTLLIATAKGAFFLAADARHRHWTLRGPMLFGHVVSHMVRDPRDGRTLLAGARTGHLGPTVFRSEDEGETWQEAERPPAFRKAKSGEEKRAVDQVFWLTPGHASEPLRWYCGTVPDGLFESRDGGRRWKPVTGFNDATDRARWGIFAVPGGSMAHSVTVDPGDPRHLYLCVSCGGVFESRDRGRTWQGLNRGLGADFLPDPDLEFGHDPHCLVMAPSDPGRLYQQNHCGIYRLDRPAETWTRIGLTMPAEIGDIGFPIAVHPRDRDAVWVFPMDGTGVWPRTCPDGRPAVYRTRDGGSSWTRHDRGLPERAWFTVYRQSLAVDDRESAGVYFGTTSGAVFASTDGSGSWTPIAAHLPRILAVEIG